MKNNNLFEQLVFQAREDNRNASLRAYISFSNGVSVSVTIGPSTLCEDKDKPYEVYITGADLTEENPTCELTADEVNALLIKCRDWGNIPEPEEPTGKMPVHILRSEILGAIKIAFIYIQVSGREPTQENICGFIKKTELPFIRSTLKYVK